MHQAPNILSDTWRSLRSIVYNSSIKSRSSDCSSGFRGVRDLSYLNTFSYIAMCFLVMTLAFHEALFFRLHIGKLLHNQKKIIFIFLWYKTILVFVRCFPEAVKSRTTYSDFDFG